MLKKLNGIARGLLGLHGYPVDPPQRADSAATATATDTVRAATRPRKAARIDARRTALLPARGAR